MIAFEPRRLSATKHARHSGQLFGPFGQLGQPGHQSVCVDFDRTNATNQRADTLLSAGQSFDQLARRLDFRATLVLQRFGQPGGHQAQPQQLLPESVVQLLAHGLLLARGDLRQFAFRPTPFGNGLFQASRHRR